VSRCFCSSWPSVHLFQGLLLLRRPGIGKHTTHQLTQSRVGFMSSDLEGLLRYTFRREINVKKTPFLLKCESKSRS